MCEFEHSIFDVTEVILARIQRVFKVSFSFAVKIAPKLWYVVWHVLGVGAFKNYHRRCSRVFRAQPKISRIKLVVNELIRSLGAIKGSAIGGGGGFATIICSRAESETWGTTVYYDWFHIGISFGAVKKFTTIGWIGKITLGGALVLSGATLTKFLTWRWATATLCTIWRGGRAFRSIQWSRSVLAQLK